MTLFNKSSTYSREKGNNSYPTNKKNQGKFPLTQMLGFISDFQQSVLN